MDRGRFADFEEGLAELAGLGGDPPAKPRLVPAWWRPGMPKALVELLMEFRYKPRWKFELRETGVGYYGGWLLVIRPWVEDVHRPGVWAEGVFSVHVPPGLAEAPEGHWERWLRDQIWQGPERHEVDEWFWVGDRRPFDPHAKAGG